MAILNIFIGSVAIKWSLAIDCNKILIGDSFDKEIVDLTHLDKPKFLLFDEVPNKSYCSYKFIDEYWVDYYKELYQEKRDYNAFYERNKNVNLLLQVTKKKITRVNLIVASGGLFSAVIMPMILMYFKNRIAAVNIILQPPKYTYQTTLKSYFLLDFICRRYSNIPIKFIDLGEEEKEGRNIEPFAIITELDSKAITIINKNKQ